MMRWANLFVICVVCCTGCARTGGVRAPATSDVAAVPAEDLRSTLADLARGHAQKIQLAFWVSTPLRPVDAPFRPFFETMGKQQAELQGELQKWASAHHLKLAFAYSDDVAGRAQKIMEDRQEKLVRGDNKLDFERDILMQMYNDYEWQLSEISALLPAVKDAELKAYLTKSLAVDEAGSAEAVALLKRFQFVTTGPSAAH